jgi:hypothetical protein
MRAMSDGEIESFVAAVDFSAATRLGLLTSEGALVALAEGFPYRVETNRHGGGLFDRCRLAQARIGDPTLPRHGVEGYGHGIARLVLQCDSRNTAMRRLLRTMNGETCEESGEITAVWHFSGGQA